MANPTVKWTGDNLKDVERLLRRHDAQAYKHGDVLHITGEGLYISLSLGDQLILDGERLGVIRPATKVAETEIIWDGNNVFEMSRFLSPFNVRCELIGRTLLVHDMTRGEEPARLEPGDKLIERGSMIVLSKAGKDHLIH